MGIESDQVVYEYLSRVGDVAQQRQLPSGTRMRLVSELRNEIDRSRAKATVDSPAAVRKIIDRLGSPDEVVTAAGGTGSTAPQVPRAHVPVQRDDEPEQRPKGLRRVVPRPRPTEPAPPAPSDAPAPPHLASAQELGDSALRPDWWRVGTTPLDDSVPGFVGGVEIPELLKPPPPKEEEKPKEPVLKKAPVVEEVVEEPAPRTRRRRFLPRPAVGWSNPLLLLAAALLVAGAILGNLFALLLGWVIAYASRRLTPNESKWAVIGMPSLALTAGVVWLWGRNEGRWGEPIAQGHMSDAISETWPWVIRGAAILSALFLLWRSQRNR
ncbi:hypothetical protein ACIQI8_34015 [Streptomyces sp. NPDC092369]|uniref:hypothetical protein n=1 Tax=Streptomyces sp. NPDC092369 TaxID=3366015 RepID=UPI0037FAF64D